jgi:hypothetical protein
MSTNNFFPSIRTVAEKTDAIPNIPDDAPPAQPIFDEERPLEEIESLCMSCGEQVGSSVRISLAVNLIIRFIFVGHYPDDVNVNTLLPRNHFNVLPM